MIKKINDFYCRDLWKGDCCKQQFFYGIADINKDILRRTKEGGFSVNFTVSAIAYRMFSSS